MVNGERFTLVTVNGCGGIVVANAKQIIPRKATTAPTTVQRWMVMGMDRHEAIEWLNAIKEKYIRGGDDYYDRQRRFAIDWAILLLKKDAVPVVRCKDCKNGIAEDEDFPNQYLCKHNGNDWNDGEHFCSYGEKKDNG